MAIKKYKPESNREFSAFESEWCSECCKQNSCEVMMYAAHVTCGSSHYPSELVYRNGTPVCTSYESGRAA